MSCEPSDTHCQSGVPQRLQIAVPHKCDRCIDVKKAFAKPLSLCSTLGQDVSGPLPLVSAKHILDKQLAEFSSSRFNRSDLGGDPITLQQGLVHASSLRCTEDNASADCGDNWASVARKLMASHDMSPNAAGRTFCERPEVRGLLFARLLARSNTPGSSYVHRRRVPELVHLRVPSMVVIRSTLILVSQSLMWGQDLS